MSAVCVHTPADTHLALCTQASGGDGGVGGRASNSPGVTLQKCFWGLYGSAEEKGTPGGSVRMGEGGRGD